MTRSEPAPDPLVIVLADMIDSALSWEAEHEEGEHESQAGLTLVAPGVDYPSPIRGPLSLRLRDDDEG